jgi:hypothetical protein
MRPSFGKKCKAARKVLIRRFFDGKMSLNDYWHCGGYYPW